MRTIVLTLISAGAMIIIPSFATGEIWTELNDRSEFWIKQDAQFRNGNKSSKRDFGYDALRFERTKYVYELVEMDTLISQSYPTLSGGDVYIDTQTGENRIVTPSVAEAWNILKKDPSIVAVVPMGFAEVAGDPIIAGYRKVRGEILQDLFSAPNLDTILCLDDREGRSPYPGQIPFILGIDWDDEPRFRYIEGIDQINFFGTKKSSTGGEQVDRNRYRETLSACNEVLQVGERIIEPRSPDYYPVPSDSKGRISYGPASIEENEPLRAERIVMLYDWNGWLNFIRTSDPAYPHDLGLLLSSPDFYDNRPCKFGRTIRSRRSISCELWAVTVSAFDGAAIIVRSEGKELAWGDIQRLTPGVLVIRAKEEEQLLTNGEMQDQVINEVADQAENPSVVEENRAPDTSISPPTEEGSTQTSNEKPTGG